MSGLNELAIRVLIGAKDNTGPGVKSASKGIKSISNQLENLEVIARRFLDFRLFTGFVQQGIQLSDTYKGLTGRIQQTVTESANLADTQQYLFDLSQRTLTPLEQTVALYVRSNEALKKFNNGQQKAAKLTEVVNLSFKAQASNAAEVSSTITQLTQAIGGGTVQWEDFGNLADTNLLLANTAAKNLGFDGLGALKKAMGEGKVSSIQLTDAIIDGFDDIKKAADAMPVTVEAAFTTLNNALIRYAGNSKSVEGITDSLALSIQFVAHNIETLIDVTVLLAKLYGVKVVSGLLASAKAYIANAQAARVNAEAARHEAMVAQQGLIVKRQVAAVSFKAAQQLSAEARVQLSLASTEEKRTLAVKKLTAALNQQRLAGSKLSQANSTLAASNAVASTSVGAVNRSFGLLDKAISGLLAWDVGTAIGEWALKFEPVRQVGNRIAEAFVIAKTGVEAMLNGTSLTDRLAQVKAIHQDFNQAVISTEDAVINAATNKAAAEERSAQRQKESIESVKKSVKSLTQMMTKETALRAKNLQTELDDRLIAIDLFNISLAEKEQLKIEAHIQFNQASLLLQQQNSDAKLALIEREFAQELISARGVKDKLNAIETEKRTAKLAVYQGLAEFYQNEVNRLKGVYNTELQAAKQSRDQLKLLAISHEKALFDISLKGLTDKQKISAQERKFNLLTSAAKKEQAKGEQADQEKINQLLADARELHHTITSAAGEGSIQIFEAKNRETDLYNAQKQVLESNAAAHQANAEKSKLAIDKTKDSLADVKKEIDEISELLKKDLALKIAVDKVSLNTTRDIIKELTKPVTKVITIVTKGGSNGEPSPQAKKSGGLIQAFSAGGYARRTGKLPGYGGGDKVKALLEPGEFIIKKTTVSKLGTRFMERLNNTASADDIPKFASGGSVGDLNQIRLDRKNKTPFLLKELKALLTEKRNARKQWLLWYDQTHGPAGGTNALFSNTLMREKGLDLKTLLLANDKHVSDKIAAIKALGNEISVISGKIGGLNAQDVTIGFLNGKKFANGGKVTGTGSGDTVPAMLTPGEFVIKKTAVNTLGSDFMNMINNGMIPVQKFANGGPVLPAAASSPASGGITIDLSINGHTAQGIFPADEGTAAILDQLKQSGRVSA